MVVVQGHRTVTVELAGARPVAAQVVVVAVVVLAETAGRLAEREAAAAAGFLLADRPIQPKVLGLAGVGHPPQVDLLPRMLGVKGVVQMVASLARSAQHHHTHQLTDFPRNLVVRLF